jgi:sodium transport system permease protein
MSMSPPRLGRFFRLTRKELVEILRDRRTVLTLVLMPVLLYPLLSVAFQQFLLSGAVGSQTPKYRFGVVSKEEAKSIFGYLVAGEKMLEHSGAFKGKGENSLPDTVEKPEWDGNPYADLEDAVSRGLVDLGVRTNPPGPFKVNFDDKLDVDLELIYREDSATGVDALHYVERLCREANAGFLSERLKAIGISQRPAPVSPSPIALPNPEGRSSRIFAVLVPLILILMTITGAVYPAIDLTAGERERGTLEVLIAAPVSRRALLGAKYIAVVTVAVLTALVNLGAMTLTLWVSGLGKAFIDEKSLSLWLVPEVFGLLLLLAAFFSGVLLVLTSFARSFKEAQAYLIPLMLASLMPGMIGFIPGLRLDGPLAVAPLINIVLLARDLLEGVAKPLAAAVVVVTTALYAVAAVAIAGRIFGAEAVLYSQEGGWGELFRRPRRPQLSATASGALLCLALMFPLSFVLNKLIVDLITRSGGGPVIDVLIAQALATITLFGLFPAVAAWLNRVRPGVGFRLTPPGVAAVLAAIVLGVCLWPIAYELGLALRLMGISSLSKEQLDKVSGLLSEYRTVPAPLVICVLGVLPAVFEELFFRGYLFNALLNATRPGMAIIASALLFGVFHLITGGGIAIERLPISAALGVVLGWLCWKSGSVLPGMILHAIHNSLLVSLGLYEQQLKDWGWSPGADEHLPVIVLVVAFVGSFLGIAAIGFVRRPSEPIPYIDAD